MYDYLELNLFSALTSFREYRPHRNSKCYFEGYFFIAKEMLLIFRGIYNFPMAVA